MSRALRILIVGGLGICLSGLAAWAGRSAFTGAHSFPSGDGSNTCLRVQAAGAPESPAKDEAESHELLFKIINFVLLAGGLAYILRKPLAGFFAARSNSIRKSLEEGRKALETSEARLQAVEKKLAHLEEEIAAFTTSARNEMEAEQQRMKQAAIEEAEKILESARAQIEVSVRAAKLDLKSYAAQQAVELAAQLIRQRLDDSSRKQLLGQFMAGLEGRERKN